MSGRYAARERDAVDLVLGIDLGTSFLKVVAVDRTGRIRGLSTTAVPVESTRPGIREVPVSAFRRMIATGIGDAVAAAAASASNVAALSYSSQANSFLLLDERLEALTPIVLWNDERAAGCELSDAVCTHFERPDFLSTTGLGLSSPLFCIAKLDWYRRRRPDTWRQTGAVMTISDYLSFEMTGRRVGDSSTASLLGLWDVRGERYWEDALAAIGLERSMLSRPIRPCSPVGPCAGALARRLGIPAEAQFAVGSLDHLAAARGAGVGAVARASESSGTVLAALTVGDEFAPLPAVSVGPDAVRGRFYTLGFEDVGASALATFCRRRGRTIDEVAREARSVPAGCLDWICVPEMVTEAPGSGFFRGDDTSAHEYKSAEETRSTATVPDAVGFRAILEALSARLARLLTYAGHGTMPDSVVSTGGGSRNDLWMEMKAAVCGVPFIRSEVPEPGAFGAALYAAVAAGWFSSLDDCAERFADPADGGDRGGEWFEPSVPAAWYRTWPERYARSVRRLEREGRLERDGDGGL